jgi:hypothetical protein
VSETQPRLPALTGALRLTRLQDDLRHVLAHNDTDEPAGTWTGLACPGHGLAATGAAAAGQPRMLNVMWRCRWGDRGSRPNATSSPISSPPGTACSRR